jgi:glycosyltransferase involved in cell wall biosynthesis
VPRALAILTDFLEEGWPSMNLCGDMLLDHLPRTGPFAVEAARVRPLFRRVATRLPVIGRRSAAFNADRLLNRFVVFPRHARRVVDQFELFHVADHSYSQLVHVLPAARTGVFCHDLDTFRCLINPAAEPRPRWFRALSGRILNGMRKAAVVFHTTAAVGAQIRQAGLIDPDRLVLAPYGVAPEFLTGAPTEAADLPWLSQVNGRPWVLHVGSCIPRKRIDVLLDVVAAVRETMPDLRLVQIGGRWTAGHRERIARADLDGAIIQEPGLNRAALSDVYRRASVVLLPSDAEGFGLPVIEALACGAAVVASDIPMLREAGGRAAIYAPVGDVAAWASAVANLLTDPASAPPRVERLAWASRFTWTAHAEIIARAYHELVK